MLNYRYDVKVHDQGWMRIWSKQMATLFNIYVDKWRMAI